MKTLRENSNIPVFRYIDDYLDCATDATKAECGAGAAEYQKKVVQFSEGTLLESIGCGKLPSGELQKDGGHVPLVLQSSSQKDAH